MYCEQRRRERFLQAGLATSLLVKGLSRVDTGLNTRARDHNLSARRNQVHLHCRGEVERGVEVLENVM